MILKHPFYILATLVLLASCHPNDAGITHVKPGSAILKTTSDTSSTKRDREKSGRKTVGDSLIFCDDSLFAELGLNLVEISKNQFQSYMSNPGPACTLDSGQFIKGSGIYVQHRCHDICETSLCEDGTNRRMILPSDYDAGIFSLSLSPSCSQLMVCSSYDGPDFKAYYDHRAEIFIFTVSTGNGLNGIKPAFKFYTKDWSIASIVWIGDRTLALKLYKGSNTGKEENLTYTYFKTNLEVK